jgi:hypothetical protein
MREPMVGRADQHSIGQKHFLLPSPGTEDSVINEMDEVDEMGEMGLAKTDIYSTGPIYQPSKLRRRNLGDAIFLAAIKDYRSMDEKVHENAEQFLYPRTIEWQDHYDWAVALAEGFNPAWLRDALDRFKAKWDRQRFERMASKARRAS